MLTRSARAALGAVVPLLAAAASAQSFDIQSFPTPNPGPFSNIFSAIAAPSDDEAWGTGDFLGPPGAKEQTLAARFNGTSWVLVPSANQGSQQDDLTGVAAPEPGDAWAVGGSMFTNGTQITLIEHWDGAKFVIVPSPNPTGTTGNSRLNAFCAIRTHNGAVSNARWNIHAVSCTQIHALIGIGQTDLNRTLNHIQNLVITVGTYPITMIRRIHPHIRAQTFFFHITGDGGKRGVLTAVPTGYANGGLLNIHGKRNFLSWYDDLHTTDQSKKTDQIVSSWRCGRAF